MQRKDLALRVLSTAAIMSIVTSIAAPAFAGTYYMANGNLSIRQDENGKVYVKSGDSDELEDKDKEVIICGGAGDNKWSNAPSGGAADEQQPHPNAGSTLNETQEGSAQTEEGSAQTKEGSAQTEGGSAQTKEGSAQTKEGSAQTKEDSAQTKEGSAQTQEGSAQTEEGSAQTQEGSAQTQEGSAQTEEDSAQTQEDSAQTQEDSAQTRKAALAPAPAADPALTTPAAGSATTSTTNVIKVVNNWVGKAAKELKIRLSNVNIKVEKKVNKAAMDVSGDGTTKVELDGQNVLDSYGTQYPASYQAGLRKQGEGTLIITDETDDRGNKITTPKSNDSGSLTAKGAGGNGAAGIGGSAAEGTKNITIEGYATVHATGSGNGAGIGGGGYYGEEKPGDAENIIIQGYATVDATGGGGGAGIGGGYAGNAKNIIIRGHSKVKATACDGAAIGGGSAGWGSYYGGSAKGIVICDHATVAARSDMGHGAAIGAAGNNGKDTEAEVTIGTAGATAEQEDVHVTATGFCGSAIGNGAKDTKVTIQGHSTIWTANIRNSTAIGSKDGNVEVNIKDNVTIDTDNVYATAEPDNSGSSIGGGDIRVDSNRKVVVNIDGGTNGKVKIGDYIEIFGKYGAISATEVNIGDNVLLKMKPWESSDAKYINVKGAEAAVGTRNNPTAGGLVNTIGDNTELWYYKRGVQHKIVHGKNVCTKNEINRQEPTCTEEGWVKYGCTYESDRHATAPEHIDEWTETIPALGHDWKDNGDANHICDRDHVTAAHTYGEWTTVKEATCTAAGQKQHTCTECGHVETEVIPVTGHHWKDKGNGTHTCPDCGATEGQPVNTNSALELRVVDAEGMDQPFTVSQNGTLRTYTGAYDIATLTGDLNTLRYLQDHGAQTIRFVTNGQTSSFDINDLLAQGSGSEVFYLTHRGAEEPTLLLVEADHSELVKD